MPMSACTTATTWTTASHRQNQSPACRLAIQITRPHSHPTANRATTTQPTYSWTRGTAGKSYEAEGPSYR